MSTAGALISTFLFLLELLDELLDELFFAPMLTPGSFTSVVGGLISSFFLFELELELEELFLALISTVGR